MRIAASLGQLASAALLSLVAYHTTCAAHDLDYHDSFASRINWKKVEPYVGADAFVRKMRYKDEPTHPFQENLDTFQPFVGVKLNKYFGVEVGYQRSEEGTKERFFNQNESPSFFGGGPLLLEDPGNWSARFDLNTTTKIKGWNFGLMGFYPICNDRTELFAKLGYSKLDLDTEYRFDVTGRDGAGGVAFSDASYNHLHDKAGMLHLGLGVKHNFFHNIGGRIFVNFERTDRFHLNSSTTLFNELAVVQAALGAPNTRSDIIRIRAHNSWSTGAGLYYTWK
jgi:hypothetical protein